LSYLVRCYKNYFYFVIHINLINYIFNISVFCLLHSIHIEQSEQIHIGLGYFIPTELIEICKPDSDTEMTSKGAAPFSVLDDAWAARNFRSTIAVEPFVNSDPQQFSDLRIVLPIGCRLISCVTTRKFESVHFVQNRFSVFFLVKFLAKT